MNFDDSQEQQQTLRYIKNHLNAVGEDKLDLRVILHGDGLTLLLEPDMADNTLFKSGYATDELTASVAALKDGGVRFLVCANTLRGKKVDHENDLYDAYQECTDEHGNTVSNSKEYKKYKLNKSLYIYLFEYLVQKNYKEMTHG